MTSSVLLIVLYLLANSKKKVKCSEILQEIIQDLAADDHPNYLWAPYNSTYILPNGSVQGGYHPDGFGIIYIGRYLRDKSAYLVTILPERNITLAEINDEFIDVQDLENARVLVNKSNTQVQWVETYNGNITYNSVPAGFIDNRNKDPDALKLLYVGKQLNQQRISSISSKSNCIHEDDYYCNPVYYLLEIVPKNYAVGTHVKKFMQWQDGGIETDVPPGAVVAFTRRRKKDQENIYLGRLIKRHTILPIYISSMNKKGFATYNGTEVPARKYEILVELSPFKIIGWEKYNGNKRIPLAAIVAGYVDSKHVYFGKGEADKKLVVGRIEPGNSCMYVHSKGNKSEICVDPQYILVNKQYS